MDLRKVAKWMGLLSNARETLLKAGVSAKDLEWVDFTDMESVSKIAGKIWPVLIKKNPQFAKMVKDTTLLSWKQKEEVVEMVESI